MFMSRESPLGSQVLQEARDEAAGEPMPVQADDGLSQEERAVGALVDAHKLTGRESEVLALLVQGRSVPFIQETLFISKNTANTHVRHIYQKVGVRTKQELIAEYRAVLSELG